MALVDRVAERTALLGVLDAARTGSSAVLVVRGEAGVGKTSLLDDAVDSATEFRVVRIAGVESEMELAYAGLHRLMLPFLDAAAKLPERQRDALGSAFGLVAGTPADRFFVGLAALSLLGGAADGQPLLCVVDDAQWLDQESVESLALVGRRLYAEGMALLFGVRDGPVGDTMLEGIADIRVEGLHKTDALQLLASVVDAPLDDQIAARIVSETQGSPLAIIELVPALSAQEFEGHELLHQPLPLGRRLEEHFLRQVRALPASTRTLLLVAAAEPSCDPRVVEAAASRLGVPMDASEPAHAEDVFTMWPEVSFRHPLIRSAVYGGAAPADRRRVHEALAAVLDPDRDADQRAWHLASATLGTSEAVAAELERAAGRARARGGYSAAGALLARAAQLTPDDDDRGGRLLAAANAHLTGGAPAKARLLIETAHLEDPLQRALAQRLDGAIRYALGETKGTVSVLLEAARALEAIDVHLARATMLEALAAARVPGRYAARGETEGDVARAAREVPLRAHDVPTVADLLLDGHVSLLLDGHAAAVPTLRRALDALRGADPESPDTLQWLWIGCWAAGAVGDDEALHVLATQLERSAREQGALVPLSVGLLFLAMSDLFGGSLDAARAHLAERDQIMAAIGRPSDVLELVVLAWEGRESETRAEAAAVSEFAEAEHQGWVLAFVNYALAVLELGLGNYREALVCATKNYRENPFLSIVGFADLTEAACRCGEEAMAAEVTEEYATRALAYGSPVAFGLVALSRALLTDGPDAESLYLQAIDDLAQGRGNLRQARARLLYGEWLRRRKRRADARAQLLDAHDMFVSMGAAAFAQRTMGELAATGARPRSRSDATRSDLTPQEANIARLASQGGTNPEIAARLFLSPSTVDYHLRKVFQKLDITSRRELSRALST